LEASGAIDGKLEADTGAPLAAAFTIQAGRVLAFGELVKGFAPSLSRVCSSTASGAIFANERGVSCFFSADIVPPLVVGVLGVKGFNALLPAGEFGAESCFVYLSTTEPLPGVDEALGRGGERLLRSSAPTSAACDRFVQISATDRFGGGAVADNVSSAAGTTTRSFVSSAEELFTADLAGEGYVRPNGLGGNAFAGIFGSSGIGVSAVSASA
jgi:hypothetical protein